MTDASIDVPSRVTHRPALRRGRHLATVLLGPLWTRTFRDPVQQGRLRLDGLSWGERQLARVGLVTLVLLLGSLLFVDLWRRGTLLDLTFDQEPVFVPEGLVPVTLVAFFVALLLIVWGALDASPSVRVVVAATYVGTVAILGAPTVFDVSDSWILAHGTTVVRVGFAVPPAALLVSILFGRAQRLNRWVIPFLRAACLLAFATMLTAMLWMHVEFTNAGFRSSVQSTIHGGFTTIDGLSAPLVILAAVAVVDFASDVSTSVTEPAAKAPPRLLNVIRAVLLAVIGLKVWFEVVSQRDYWAAYVTSQPSSVVRTAVMIAVLVAAAVLVNRLAPPRVEDEVDEAKERLTLVGAAVVSLAGMVGVILLGFGEMLLSLTGALWPVEVFSDYPVGPLSTWIPLVASVVAIPAGVALLRRGWSRLRPGMSRELGSGLVVLGVWNLQAWVISAIEAPWGFSYPAVDVLVTAGVLVWLAVRWRTLDLGGAALALAVLIFSWLVMSRGDYISFLGGLLGLPGVVVVVFGILYTLASGSGFASDSSRRLPREARTLMFTGYLLVSVVILHWLEAVHLPPSDLEATFGFYFLAIPLAAWLLARRIIPRSRAAEHDARV